MHVSRTMLAVALVALAGPAAAAPLVTDLTRDHLEGDVYHYGFTLKVGDTPNARLRIHRVVRERAPWVPRPTAVGVMAIAGDFSSFATNFAPALGGCRAYPDRASRREEPQPEGPTKDVGLAPVTEEGRTGCGPQQARRREGTPYTLPGNPPSSSTGMATYLASRGIDVWGMDRRWVSTPVDGDLSDFGEMGTQQEVDDVGRAMAVARGIRLATGSGADRLHLMGFSRGGVVAYAVAAGEAGRPAWQRNVKGLVPLDVYAVAPADDPAARAWSCDNADVGRFYLEQGFVDNENAFIIDLGRFFLEAPDETSPIFGPPFTNRDALLMFVGQTYQAYTPTALYHLAAPDIEDGFPVGLRDSSETAIATWLAGGAPHQSFRESVEKDELWCGEAPLPIPYALDRIRVPLFYLGAAGGFGASGIYSTTLVGSHDVTTQVITRNPPGGLEEELGHADLLFAADAETLAWRPLAAWLLDRR